jgi:hypothetical protein
MCLHVCTGKENFFEIRKKHARGANIKKSGPMPYILPNDNGVNVMYRGRYRDLTSGIGNGPSYNLFHARANSGLKPILF